MVREGGDFGPFCKILAEGAHQRNPLVTFMSTVSSALQSIKPFRVLMSGCEHRAVSFLYRCINAGLFPTRFWVPLFLSSCTIGGTAIYSALAYGYLVFQLATEVPQMCLTTMPQNLTKCVPQTHLIVPTHPKSREALLREHTWEHAMFLSKREAGVGLLVRLLSVVVQTSLDNARVPCALYVGQSMRSLCCLVEPGASPKMPICGSSWLLCRFSGNSCAFGLPRIHAFTPYPLLPEPSRTAYHLTTVVAQALLRTFVLFLKSCTAEGRGDLERRGRSHRGRGHGDQPRPREESRPMEAASRVSHTCVAPLCFERGG